MVSSGQRVAKSGEGRLRRIWRFLRLISITKLKKVAKIIREESMLKSTSNG